MDLLFLEGVAAVVSAFIVFCGSVWLLLAMVLGSRLAYFITASVTLAFVGIMGIVWSMNQLGPVGELPEWLDRGVGQQEDIDFGPLSSYPEGDWYAAPEDDDVQKALASSLEGDAGDALEHAIEEEAEGVPFTAANQALVNSDKTRLLEQDGTTYGVAVFESIGPELAEDEGVPPEGTPVTIVMEYDPKNPLGLARMMTVVTFLLLGLHLFGLSRAERNAKQPVAQGAAS